MYLSVYFFACSRFWIRANNTSRVNTEIKVNGQKLQTITHFKYLGSVITDHGSKPELPSKIAQTTADWQGWNQFWNDRSISLSSKIRLIRFLVTSIFLDTCESWTITAELQRRIQAMEMTLLPQDTTHLTQRPCYQRGSPRQDPASNRTTRRPPDHRKATQTAVVWSCLPFIRSGQNHIARHSERGEEDEADGGRGGKTTSGNGQAWGLPSPKGQWRTGENGGN